MKVKEEMENGLWKGAPGNGFDDSGFSNHDNDNINFRFWILNNVNNNVDGDSENWHYVGRHWNLFDAIDKPKLKYQ